MASEKADATVLLSDTEGQEKPVREKLKKTSIQATDLKQPPAAAGESFQDTPLDDGANNSATNVQTRDTQGRLQKKRSYDETEGGVPEDMATTKQHTRKRSRDSTAEGDDLHNDQRKNSGESGREPLQAPDETFLNGSAKGLNTIRPSTPDTMNDTSRGAAVDAVASPKTKKSRLHSSSAEPHSSKADASTTPDEADLATENDSTRGQVDTAPVGRGFANTSAVSPFGTLTGSKSPDSKQSHTSPSAFAASGFGALSGSSASGFGAIGKKSDGFGAGGSFATGSKGTALKPEGDKAHNTSSAFGGTLGQSSGFSSGSSAFGTSKSGFGTLGRSAGGFGTASGSAFGSLAGAASGGLTSFASGKPSLFSSTKPSSTFGASEDEKTGGEDGGSDEDQPGYKSPLSSGQEKQDDRFYEQELETGEEDERMEYSCRAKLYNFAALADGKKEWRERGLGILRLNVKKKVRDGDVKPQARFLMRADGSHRVVLNTPVKKEISFGDPNGGPPQGGYMYFMGTIAEGSENKAGLELLQLKMRQQFALDLYDKVTELQKDM